MKRDRLIIKEALGVHEDVKALAEFLHDYFSSAGNKVSDELMTKLRNKEIEFHKWTDLESEVQKGKYIPKGKKVFTSEDLPTLKDLKIDKLIVNYNPNSIFGGKGTNAYFNSGKSYITDKGVVGYLNFISVPSVSTIYHELTHVLQFYKIGSKGMASRLKPVKSTGVSSSFVKKGLDENQLKVLETFCYLVYQSSDMEITAKTTETYATVKNRLGKHHPSTRIKMEDEEEEALVTKLIKESYGWRVSEIMVEYDIFEEFKKLDSETTITFFSHVHDFNKFIKLHDKGWPRFVEVVKTIFKIIYINRTKDVKILSDDEVLKMMEQFNRYINTQGVKLRKKLGKIYAHFI